MVKKQNTEVELRAKVNLNIIKRIKNYPLKRYLEHDLYFRHQFDTQRNWLARIRKRNSQYYLTFKSSKQFGEGAWNEVDIPISAVHAKQMREFLLKNDFNLEVEIIKRRKSYKIDGMEVNIDEIKELGIFIEAEIITSETQVEKARQKIKIFFRKLGIDEDQITPSGYVTLMRNK